MYLTRALRPKADAPALQDDFRVEERRKPRLNALNVYLKKFQYRNALDAALKVRRPSRASICHF